MVDANCKNSLEKPQRICGFFCLRFSWLTSATPLAPIPLLFLRAVTPCNFPLVASLLRLRLLELLSSSWRLPYPIFIGILEKTTLDCSIADGSGTN